MEHAGLISTVTDADAVHELASVPVTIYVVVEVGETITDAPLPRLVLQEYVLAPAAVSVAELPPQVPPAVTVGKFTVTIAVAVAVHGVLFVTVTV